MDRLDVAHLEENPGLKNPQVMERAVAFAWVDGVRVAMRETGLDPDIFPADNPFTLDELLDEGATPEGRAEA